MVEVRGILGLIKVNAFRQCLSKLGSFKCDCSIRMVDCLKYFNLNYKSMQIQFYLTNFRGSKNLRSPLGPQLP